MTKDLIEEILNLAVNAPSGHNSQPWKFIMRDKSLYLYNLPYKDKTLFNYKQRGSLVALGALIENIVIIASNKKFKAKVVLFPEDNDPTLIARLSFESTTEKYQYENLFPFILKRTTNRKTYKKISLLRQDEEKINNFLQSLEVAQNKILLYTDEKKIATAAHLFSLGDKLLFENFYLHKGLFDNVNWTLEEEIKRREGLYVKTKELSFLERLIFKHFLSKWHIINQLNAKIKFSLKVAQKRQKLYQQSSAIGLITTPADMPEDFVRSGRLLERWWLFISSLNLSFQPISVGLLYLGQWLEKDDINPLTPLQKTAIKEVYTKIKRLFNIRETFPVFSFRIGYSEPPTASSLKKPPKIIYHKEHKN